MATSKVISKTYGLRPNKRGRNKLKVTKKTVVKATNARKGSNEIKQVYKNPKHALQAERIRGKTQVELAKVTSRGANIGIGLTQAGATASNIAGAYKPKSQDPIQQTINGGITTDNKPGRDEDDINEPEWIV